MNETVKQFLKDKIRALTDDVQLYKYVEKDEMQAEITSLVLENVKNVLGALNNLEELIKGKDEYIAKLCNDRAELKAELKELQEFAREIAKLPHFLENNHITDISYKIRNSKYNENERCWLYQDIRCSTDDKNGWFLNERDGAMVFSKERAEELIERFKNWGFEGAKDLIIVLEYKQAHDRYVLFKKVVEKYGKFKIKRT